MNKSRCGISPLVLLTCMVWLLLTGLVLAEGLLQVGAKGGKVIEVQSYLHQLKYLSCNPTGYYGKRTSEAVKSFQIEYGLTVDGKVGGNTLQLLRQAVHTKNAGVEYTVLDGDTLPVIAARFNTSLAAIMAKNNLPGPEISVGQRLIIPLSDNHNSDIASRSKAGGVQELPWSIVDQLWKTGEAARIIDVATGKSFAARRFYGYYHADVEPLTKEDTQIMHEIYGGHWSWSRRAVIVQLRNLYIAGSINGMPHGRESIRDNGFRGQFCAHFLGSKVHANGSVDHEHQVMVERAAEVNLTELGITFK